MGIQIGPGKGKKKAGGDLAPAKRKVSFSSGAEKSDVTMLNRANSGNLKKVAMTSNSEAELSKAKSKAVASKAIAKYEKGTAGIKVKATKKK